MVVLVIEKIDVKGVIRRTIGLFPGFLDRSGLKHFFVKIDGERVALHAGIRPNREGNRDQASLVRAHALHLVRDVQFRGSGASIVASRIRLHGSSYMENAALK